MNIKDIQRYQVCLKGRIDFTNTNKSLLDLLLALSIQVEKPLQITSSFRTPQLNRTVGGSPTSSHLSGKAVDIACTDSFLRIKLVHAAVHLGFHRIGVYDKHIHLDIDNCKSAALWLGKSK